MRDLEMLEMPEISEMNEDSSPQSSGIRCFWEKIYKFPGINRLFRESNIYDKPALRRNQGVHKEEAPEYADVINHTVSMLIGQTLVYDCPGFWKEPAFRQIKTDKKLIKMSGVRSNGDSNASPLSSIGYWLPKIARAAEEGGMLKIQKTRIARIPPLIMDIVKRGERNDTTNRILNEYCVKALGLEYDGDYYIEVWGRSIGNIRNTGNTGNIENAEDAENAENAEDAKNAVDIGSIPNGFRIQGSETRKIGELMLKVYAEVKGKTGAEARGEVSADTEGRESSGYTMPNGLQSSMIEWSAREVIHPRFEDGMPLLSGIIPLRIGYRILADFDTRRARSVAPCWWPGQRWGGGGTNMAKSYITASPYRIKLERQYEENKLRAIRAVEDMMAGISDVSIRGQWFVEIMQERDDLWLINIIPSTFLRNSYPQKLRVPGLKPGSDG